MEKGLCLYCHDPRPDGTDCPKESCAKQRAAARRRMGVDAPAATHSEVSYPHAGGCEECRVVGRCNFCGKERDEVGGSVCTNGRCRDCHSTICTPGGTTADGHGFGKVGSDWRERRLGATFVGFMGDRVPNSGGGAPVYVCEGSSRKPLDPRHDLRNHSPDGFQWGYGGSGPAQLALAICANVVGAKRAQKIYHDFKFRIVAGLPDAWELERADVLAIIELLEAERNEREAAR